MKRLVFYFIILFLAVCLGIIIHRTPGYVLISFGTLRIETTLWVALFALLIFFFLLRTVVNLVRGTYHIPHRYRDWVAQRHERQSQKLTQEGICELLEGQWRNAEKSLVKAAKKQQQWLINYLGAAKAAQQQNDLQHRDAYLQKAVAVANKSDMLAIGIVRAGWQIESKQYQEALHTLNELQLQKPNQPVVLRGLKDVYLALGQWEILRELLPKLRKHQVLETAELEALEQEVYLVLLTEMSKDNDSQRLEQIWQEMPHALHRNPLILSMYIKYLIQHNEQEKAEKLLKLQLRKSLDGYLLECYAEVVSPNPAKQLSRAEAWLKENSQNADLLYCLGKLCIRHRLWGKARTYLEGSLKLRPRVDVYLALGQVLEQLGDNTEALDYYRQGLQVIA